MVDFSSLKCIMLRYHPPKCLLDAKAKNYPYLECFAILLTSELETWADQQRAETPDTLGRPVLKQGCFMGKYFSFYRFPWKTLLLEAVQQEKKSFLWDGKWDGMGNVHLCFHYCHSRISSWVYTTENFSQAADNAMKNFTHKIAGGGKSLRGEVPLTHSFRLSKLKAVK